MKKSKLKCVCRRTNKGKRSLRNKSKSLKRRLFQRDRPLKSKSPKNHLNHALRNQSQIFTKKKSKILRSANTPPPARRVKRRPNSLNKTWSKYRVAASKVKNQRSHWARPAKVLKVSSRASRRVLARTSRLSLWRRHLLKSVMKKQKQKKSSV